MEAVVPAVIIVTAIALLVLFDLLALRYGVDSRRSIGDDHQRSLTR